MRFLKVDRHGDLKITDDLPQPPGPYAVLSHRWYADNEEVTFKTWDQSSSRTKPGYSKLVFCADWARCNGLKYIWVDTCCIDRTNAVELDEAIRSMFRWYQNAEKCYVYLSDVKASHDDSNKTPPSWEPAFRRSTWFKRGWTLQELLAPKSVYFFSKDGQYLGTKTTLEQQVHEITGIPLKALRGEALSKFGVEERFQWARHRETKKAEDKAYCLFGIFNVFLPVMYGEGESAVQRLKDEIGITVDQIDAAIEQAYSEGRLRVERLSGKSLSLEDCFVNLCVVDHKRDNDTRLSHSASDTDLSTDRHQQLSKFSLAARLKVETTPESKQVVLATLFNRRDRKDGSSFRPNRVLIWGGAGMGKTTLCKKMIHDFYHGDLWRDLYDRVVWLPLRRLKLMQYEAHDVVALMQKEFSLDGSRKNLGNRLKETVVHSERSLFILDGLDEVSYSFDPDTSIGRVLQSLLARRHVIITSRPHSTSILDVLPPDLELETIGFSSQQVEEYIQRTAKETNMLEKMVSEIQSFIKDRPLVQSLARIPVQLDAMCYSWNTKHFPKDNVSMTALYQAISRRLWAKDIVRKGKKVNGQSVTKQQIEQSPNVEVFVKAENEFLQELAFHGLCKEIIEFDTVELQGLQVDQSILGDTLVHGSFLRSSDNSLEVSDRTLHFIHLTFQEFFGARHFVRHWTSGTALSLWRSSPYGLSAPQAELLTPEDFLKMEKYVGRYDIFWRFVTGLLYIEPDLSHLHRFLEVLQEEPSDLVGLIHQRLTIHCLSEIGPIDGEVKDAIREREELYMQWILCESRFKKWGSRTSLMWEAECSDYILETLLEKGETQDEVMKVLCHRPSVSPKILDTVLYMLNSMENTTIRPDAIRLFGQQCNPIREKDFLSFWNSVQDSTWHERSEFAKALRQSQNLGQPAVKALITLLRDPEGDVRSQAARALGSQVSLSGSAFEGLLALLQDPDGEVQSQAIWALGGQTHLSSSAIEGLIALLQHPYGDVQSQAASALGGQASLPSSAIEGLIALLQDPEGDVLSQAVWALRGQTYLPGSAIEALIALLQHLEEDVRSKAAWALGGQTTLSGSVIKTLITLLQDPGEYVRSGAASALGSQTNLSEFTIEALITLLQDPKENVRSEAARALNRQTSLSSLVIEALVVLLHDPRGNVRSEASRALNRQTSLPSSAVKALIALLQHPKGHIRCGATRALGGQTSLSSSVIKALIALLQDLKAHVRSEAACALSRQVSLSSCAIKALIALLQHSEWDVRSQAAHLLVSRGEICYSIGELDSSALQKLLNAWLQRGSVTCYMWDGMLHIDINGKQWKAPLQNGQQARLKTMWMEAQKALGLPTSAVSRKQQKHKRQADSPACSPQSRSRRK